MRKSDVRAYRVLLRKISAHKWQVWVGVFPYSEAPFTVAVVRHAGGLAIDRERMGLKAGAKLPYNTLTTADFTTRQAAYDVAWQMGKYMLGLGDQIYAWLDEEKG